MTRPEHILATLAEEGGEVAKECMKALRFGIDDKVTLDPNGPRGTEGPANRDKIEAEMIDMLGVYQMAVDEGLVADLGFNTLKRAVWEGMQRKRARVESFMGYARRVGALNEIPKLSSLACFAGMKDQPFRVLVEGPHGFHLTASGATPEQIVATLTRSTEDTFPPHYTEATLPTVPTLVQIIDPRNEGPLPVVTVFPADRTADGYLVQWENGTKGRRHAEDLRPLWFASLDQPRSFAESLVALPFPTDVDGQPLADHKERVLSAMAIPGLGQDDRAERMAKIAAAWGDPVDSVFPHSLLAKVIVPAPRGFPEGSQTQHGLDSRGWPIRTRVKGEGADWDRKTDDEFEGRKVQVLQLVASKLRGNKLGEIRIDGKTVVWASFPTVGSPIFGIAGTMREAMVFVELAQAGVDFAEAGTHRREAAAEKLGPAVGHPYDDKRTRELERPALWRFGMDLIGRPVWRLHPAIDHGNGQWEPLTVEILGTITKQPGMGNMPNGFWTAEIDGTEDRHFMDDGVSTLAEGKARAQVIAVLKEREAKADAWAPDEDDIRVRIAGDRYTWKRRTDDSLVIWELFNGWEPGPASPMVGKVMEANEGQAWLSEALGLQIGNDETAELARATVERAIDLENSPL